MTKKVRHLLIILLVVSLFLRLWRIDFPKAYVFDEVYYPFTAMEYLKGNPDAWVWWGKAPQGNAFAWVNPPLAQEIMAGSMFLLGSTEGWAWRFPEVLLGVLAIYLVFLIGKELFDNEQMALLAAFLFSIDGLNFVQSRTGMLDIYLTAFSLASFLFCLKKKYLWSAIFLGMAIANKWTGFYFLPVIFYILWQQHQLKKILYFVIAIPVVYLVVYLPFFLTGHSPQDFIELLKQEWWYHTHLQATHSYASPWWSWPLALYPVWFYVQYYEGGWMSNIFSAGNPVLFWVGSWAIVLSVWDFFKNRSKSLLLILLGFAVFWLPWALSPRIMFLYYFAPAVPFLCLALAYQMGKLWIHPHNRTMVKTLVILITISFLIFLPFYTGLPLPKEFSLLFFNTNLAKNPF